MGVDANRQKTHPLRRRLITETFNQVFDTADPESPISRFKKLVEGPPRMIIASGDIDGIVSSMMLAAVTNWRIAAIIIRSDSVYVPRDWSLQEVVDGGFAYGVDVFSTRFPTVSNHPVLFGVAEKGGSVWLRDALGDFDREMSDRSSRQGSLNLSLSAGISARFKSDHPQGLPYKYPLGTAQLLLAALEVVGRSPRFYDRQYLPWFVANADGGVESIRKYAWNVEMWWSALAATAGPASMSEALYRLATNQRPNEFLDVDRRFRYDDERASALNTKWNLISYSMDTIRTVSEILSDHSGWPDPFLGGAAALGSWTPTPTTHNALTLNGLTKQDPQRVGAHLRAALDGVHTNFSTFRERGIALGWMLDSVVPELEALLDPPPVEETDAGDESDED